MLGYKGRRGGFGRGIAGFRDPSGWVIGKLPDTALSSPEFFFFQDGQKDKSLNVSIFFFFGGGGTKS